MDSVPPTRGSRSRSKSRISLSSSAGRSKYTNYIFGIGLLLIVVFLWTSSNFVTQSIFEEGYDKAFLVTYLNTSAFTLYIIPYAVRRGIQKFGKNSKASIPDPEQLPPFTTLETAKLASVFCIFWFIANWTVNASLDYTSVASATILSSMSGFFTLLFGRIFKVEKLSLAKIAAVFMSFCGVVLVSISDATQRPPNPALATRTLADRILQPGLGDVLALCSAVFYAIYTVLLKVRIGSESRIDMKLFFGFVGLFNIIGLWPIALILHWTGVEKFELPTTSKQVAALLVNMFITWSSDYLYVIAMLKTTPLVVTIGLSLTIPLAVVGDFFLSRPVKFQVIGGALLVLVSFVTIGLDDTRLRQVEIEPASEQREDRSRGDVELDERLQLSRNAGKQPVSRPGLASVAIAAMPKDRQSRKLHNSSVKLAKRQFAVPEGSTKVEHVEIGSFVQASANELLVRPSSSSTKKMDKQYMKREALLHRLESTQSPYSKSHLRRMKRKAREQIANGLDDMQNAIASLDGGHEMPSKTDHVRDESSVESERPSSKIKAKPGQIGEGKGATLPTQQRKRILQAERLRHPLILQNPQFSTNPFQTIRTHAQNTLVKHAPPAS
ncbi:vacuolar membrane protein [Moniliophthora roreri MCA 2997]|uniref:Ribosome biogenesis protein SLX9 n=1 Tax=Moniliophthora roreri (strain MCA 2997) TaxID=1381753 RepID=V2XGI5_MONRO|nr:vacuolar membrane protein [Moniliophthora roreri MCA 2997]